MLARARGGDSVGICFDTCHAHASGYDLSTEEGYDRTFDAFARIIGLEPAVPWLPVVGIVRLGGYLRLSVAAGGSGVRIGRVGGGCSFPSSSRRSRLSLGCCARTPGTPGTPGTVLDTLATRPSTRIFMAPAQARLLLSRRPTPCPVGSPRNAILTQ